MSNRNRSSASSSAPAGRSQEGSEWRGLDLPGGEVARAPQRLGAHVEGSAHRCSCGSLLARLVAGGVELKCRRCKRIVLLPFSTERAAP